MSESDESLAPGPLPGLLLDFAESAVTEFMRYGMNEQVARSQVAAALRSAARELEE